LDEIEGLSKAGLELTRGISPEETPRHVDLDELVRQVSRDYAAVGQLVPVTGRCGAIDVRPLPIRRTLVNLVDNALKYGKEVAIELAEGGDHVRIDVRDRGPGIPPAHLQKVVHPFYRVEPSRNRHTGGTGLGLAIAKDIVEAHGGELEIANRESGGLQVTVRLPR
jgi:signal transduction histidine kinase